LTDPTSDSSDDEKNLEAGLRAQQAGDWELAIRLYEQVIAGDASNSTASLNLARILLMHGRLSLAEEAYRQVLSRNSGHVGAMNDLANCCLLAGRSQQAVNIYRQALSLAKKPLAFRIASNYLMALQYVPDATDQYLRMAAEEVGKQMPVRNTSESKALDPQKPVRLGMVSADFCDHPVGLFLLPVLRTLNRDNWHVTLYSNGGQSDWTSRELQALGDWRDIAGKSHDEVADIVRRDAVDVLFDLSGHTSGNRLPVFAMKPAPMQISWLGYFATTGVPGIDHVLMDWIHAPAAAEIGFSEKVARMPNSRFCYEPVSFAPAVSALPCLQRGHVTFGSFNNTAKLNDLVIDAWAKILMEVPRSRMILKWRTFADLSLQARVLARFETAGVDASRIEFRTHSFHIDMLEEYSDIDIGLDPFPFTGGLTTCEALWMGVPVVTLPGSRPVSRQSLSILTAIGCAEWCSSWVATDIADYVRKSVGLATDLENLVWVRSSLREVMRSSSLMNARQFTRNFEDLLAQLWKSQCAEQFNDVAPD
jgi:predicted O-linked N-acetylglucosamine transferase (SPINDLY family)